jgi:hypothetical protein
MRRQSVASGCCNTSDGDSCGERPDLGSPADACAVQDLHCGTQPYRVTLSLIHQRLEDDDRILRREQRRA